VIIKLTNVSAKHKGKILLLNPKYIMAVFEDTITNEDGSIENVTAVYSATQENWIVKETIDELWLKLKRDEI